MMVAVVATRTKPAAQRVSGSSSEGCCGPLSAFCPRAHSCPGLAWLGGQGCSEDSKPGPRPSPGMPGLPLCSCWYQ